METIQSVTKKTNLSPRTLRVWEEAGLLTCSRDDLGVRLFQADVYQTIEKVQLLKEFGLTLNEIALIINNKVGSNKIESILSLKREKLEIETIKLANTSWKIKQVEELILDQLGKFDATDFILPTKDFDDRFVKHLLQEKGLSESNAHIKYINDELSGMSSAQKFTWFSTLIRIKRYAEKNDISLSYTRGFAPSSLSLFLVGWSQFDPLTYNLIPHSPLEQSLHFDIPYSCSEHLLDFLDDAVPSGDFKIAALKLPILDILSNFWTKKSSSSVNKVSDDQLVERLREGDVENVFCIDESGDWLVNRIFPELPEEIRAIKRTSADIRSFSPKSKEDVFRFLALRRKKTWNLFESYLSGNNQQIQKCLLAKALPESNRGYCFFREELLIAIQKVTGWDWKKVRLFRRHLRNGDLNASLAEEFILITDCASLTLAEQWEQQAFHKAHLVGWWQLISASLTAKIVDKYLWTNCINEWESEHNLSWNDFGIDWRGIKLFS